MNTTSENIVLFIDSNTSNLKAEEQALRSIVALVSNYVCQQSKLEKNETLKYDPSLWLKALNNVPYTTPSNTNTSSTKNVFDGQDQQSFESSFLSVLEEYLPEKLDAGISPDSPLKKSLQAIAKQIVTFIQKNRLNHQKFNVNLLQLMSRTNVATPMIQFINVLITPEASILPPQKPNAGMLEIKVSVSNYSFDFSDLKSNPKQWKEWQTLVRPLNTSTFPCVDSQQILKEG